MELTQRELRLILLAISNAQFPMEMQEEAYKLAEKIKLVVFKDVR